MGERKTVWRWRSQQYNCPLKQIIEVLTDIACKSWEQPGRPENTDILPKMALKRRPKRRNKYFFSFYNQIRTEQTWGNVSFRGVWLHIISNEVSGLKEAEKARDKGWVHQPTGMVVGGWGAECHGHRWIIQGLILLSRHLADSTVAFFLRHLFSSPPNDYRLAILSHLCCAASGLDIEMPPTRTRLTWCVHTCLCVSTCACARAAAETTQTPLKINGFHMLCPLRVDPSALSGAEPEARA